MPNRSLGHAHKIEISVGRSVFAKRVAPISHLRDAAREIRDYLNDPALRPLLVHLPPDSPLKKKDVTTEDGKEAVTLEEEKAARQGHPLLVETARDPEEVLHRERLTKLIRERFAEHSKIPDPQLPADQRTFAEGLFELMTSQYGWGADNWLDSEAMRQICVWIDAGKELFAELKNISSKRYAKTLIKFLQELENEQRDKTGRKRERSRLRRIRESFGQNEDSPLKNPVIPSNKGNLTVAEYLFTSLPEAIRCVPNFRVQDEHKAKIENDLKTLVQKHDLILGVDIREYVHALFEFIAHSRNVGKRVNFAWLNDFDPTNNLQLADEMIREDLYALVRFNQSFRLRFEEFWDTMPRIFEWDEKRKKRFEEFINKRTEDRKAEIFLPDECSPDFVLVVENNRPVVRPFELKTDILDFSNFISRTRLTDLLVRIAEKYRIPFPERFARTKEIYDKEKETYRTVHVVATSRMISWVEENLVTSTRIRQADRELIQRAVEFRNVLLSWKKKISSLHGNRETLRTAALVQAIMNLQTGFLESNFDSVSIVPRTYKEIIEEYTSDQDGQSLAGSVGEYVIEDGSNRNTVGKKLRYRGKDSPERWGTLRLPNGKVISLEHFVNATGGNPEGRSIGTQTTNFRQYDIDPVAVSKLKILKIVRKIMAEEPLDDPLPDAAIVNKKDRAMVRKWQRPMPARRTLAKYRDMMGIPIYEQRKRDIKALRAELAKKRTRKSK